MLPQLLHIPLAYLDPGSGALIVQMLLAGVAGLVLFLKMQGRRVLSLFGQRRKHERQSSEDAEQG
ncbi:MAG TPA: hypothetical protein VMT18_10725 [Planctomycetota bacterium]|nr:hypothetical protein [Planctomycetota bacterium]